MRAPYYTVEATCYGCGLFIVQRKKVNKISTDGREYTIGQVVCPSCRLWAEVNSIVKVVV